MKIDQDENNKKNTRTGRKIELKHKKKLIN